MVVITKEMIKEDYGKNTTFIRPHLRTKKEEEEESSTGYYLTLEDIKNIRINELKKALKIPFFSKLFYAFGLSKRTQEEKERFALNLKHLEELTEEKQKKYYFKNQIKLTRIFLEAVLFVGGFSLLSLLIAFPFGSLTFLSLKYFFNPIRIFFGNAGFTLFEYFTYSYGMGLFLFAVIIILIGGFQK